MLHKVSSVIVFEGEGDITGEVVVEASFVGVEGVTGAGVEGGGDDTEADSGAELFAMASWWRAARRQFL